LTKLKLLSREKLLRGSQTQEIYYSEDKTSYKAVVLTYLYVNASQPDSDTYLYVNASMDSFSLGLLPKLDFN